MRGWKTAEKGDKEILTAALLCGVLNVYSEMTGSGREPIAMMHSAESRKRNYPSICRSFLRRLPPSRGCLAQAEMCTVGVVIVDILGHQAFQMAVMS